MNKTEFVEDFLHLLKKHSVSKSDMVYVLSLVLVSLKDEELLIEDERTGENSFIVIDGKDFKCGCGSNLFSKMKSGRYKCNSCGTLYEGS